VHAHVAEISSKSRFKEGSCGWIQWLSGRAQHLLNNCRRKLVRASAAVLSRHLQAFFLFFFLAGGAGSCARRTATGATALHSYWAMGMVDACAPAVDHGFGHAISFALKEVTWHVDPEFRLKRALFAAPRAAPAARTTCLAPHHARV